MSTPKKESKSIFNPWQLMIDLNEGKTILISADDFARLATYFDVHRCEQKEFNVTFHHRDAVEISKKHPKLPELPAM